MKTVPRRIDPRDEEGGIAAVILFLLGIMIALGAYFSSGSTSTGGRITADKVSVELLNQANLIRAKVQECWLVTQGRPAAGWPARPASGLVSDVDCPGDNGPNRNLWSGPRTAFLPVPPSGYGAWNYESGLAGLPNCGPSGNAGGACAWTDPASGAWTDASVREGAEKAAGKFSASEADLDPSSGRFTIWIKRN